MRAPLYVTLRTFVAFFLLLYGFAKINGAQFTVLDSALDRPMGQVSGFWLTWYFFGYSKVYGTLVAVAQIAGAVLLMFRRTVLLGTLLLLPILTNIVLIDVFYGVEGSALVMAIVLEAALLYLLFHHREELVDLLWTRQAPEQGQERTRGQRLGKAAVCVGMIVFTAGFTWWVANVNNRAPTPIDGAWEVVAAEPDSEDAVTTPDRIFFERERAHMAVLRYGPGRYVQRHFAVDPDSGRLRIWERWLQQDELLFDGHYVMTADDGRLRVEGRFVGSDARVSWALERIDPGSPAPDRPRDG